MDTRNVQCGHVLPIRQFLTCLQRLGTMHTHYMHIAYRRDKSYIRVRSIYLNVREN
jgi:hypothetical protein